MQDEIVCNEELASRRRLRDLIAGTDKDSLMAAVVPDGTRGSTIVSVWLRPPFERSTRRLLVDVRRLSAR